MQYKTDKTKLGHAWSPMASDGHPWPLMGLPGVVGAIGYHAWPSLVLSVRYCMYGFLFKTNKEDKTHRGVDKKCFSL